ncbi:hypothetical protein ACQKQD_19195 [Methylobacterium sp. NPDC080182]|uniref:hypothetical protein n=1 Tax=Methylobacterium sp. NPDC080182 TaxID=3390590 RepID=UPI003D0479B8
MAFSRTPYADRIAAGMSAAGGDRLFAPGAAYRAGGFDEMAWLREVNTALRVSKPGHEVRVEVSLEGERRWTLCRVSDGRVTPLTKTLKPEHTSIQALESMVDVNIVAIRRAYMNELDRRAEEKAMQPRDKVSPPKRRARPVVETEEAAAPAMGR